MAKSEPAVIVLSGGKGGVGRSTLSRNFLVASALAGFRTVGFDLDRQATLHKWHQRRCATRATLPECASTAVFPLAVADWRTLFAEAANYQIAIVDTAPGIEENLASMLSLCQAARFVVVPCGGTHDDIESVVPWVKTLSNYDVRSAFVLNKVNPRTKSFQIARNTLLQHGPVCPVEVPLLEDIHSPSVKGLCTLDFENAKGAAAMESVWTFIRREAGL